MRVKRGMEQRRNERGGETGDFRENPPTSGIIRHDSHIRRESNQFRLAVHFVSHRPVIRRGLCSTPPAVVRLSRTFSEGAYHSFIKPALIKVLEIKRSVHLRIQGQEARERYGRHDHARLVPHRSYAQGVQCFRRGTPVASAACIPPLFPSHLICQLIYSSDWPKRQFCPSSTASGFNQSQPLIQVPVIPGHDDGAALEFKGVGNESTPRKPARKWHCPARFPYAKIRELTRRGSNPDRRGGRPSHCYV
ncbi:hypothetical protein PR048_028999 [Dryococelus australis]|uniref:Uncharacterized protein n=1 Tax=Dryococelus australis TaxID=614101 RepID=A0ABQ9GCK2_9NEOP|nr:hypothetical protein PR048_028999 [Dryococelus australis]